MFDVNKITVYLFLGLKKLIDIFFFDLNLYGESNVIKIKNNRLINGVTTIITSYNSGEMLFHRPFGW